MTVIFHRGRFYLFNNLGSDKHLNYTIYKRLVLQFYIISPIPLSVVIKTSCSFLRAVLLMALNSLHILSFLTFTTAVRAAGCCHSEAATLRAQAKCSETIHLCLVCHVKTEEKNGPAPGVWLYNIQVTEII